MLFLTWASTRRAPSGSSGSRPKSRTLRAAAGIPIEPPRRWRLLLRLELETDPTEEAQARELAEQAEQTCLVSVSLDLPVETAIEVRPRQAS
jgi:organic hydroperoxide reductase OsmC/OhrA